MFTFCGDSRGKYANVLGNLRGIHTPQREIYTRRTVGSLHFKREIVGIGLLLQNYFNGEEENNEYLISLMKKYGMPHTVSGVGAALSGEFFKNITIISKTAAPLTKITPRNAKSCVLGLNTLKKLIKDVCDEGF